MSQVIVTVDATGQSKIEVQGVCGPGCRQLTAAIEMAIGQTTADTPTPEMQRLVGAAEQSREMQA